MGRGLDYLGKYRIIRMVRSGHTCQIFEAMDDFDHKKFAIKALVPEQRKNKEEIKALQHELAVAKDFDHDNVIEVYEIGTDGSVYFLVLELSPHPNLKLMIRNDFEMALYRAPTIIEQVFISLGYMNDQGWVHSDVKPDNFLVSNEGDIKLIDFAISEKIRTGFSRWFASKPRIQGTMSYMSPEQIRGEALMPQSDIYSAGILFYELLSRKLPYTGESSDELLRKHISGNIPDVRTHNPNVTEECSELIKQMLAKKPENRPKSFKSILNSVSRLRIFRAMPKAPLENKEQAGDE